MAVKSTKSLEQVLQENSELLALIAKQKSEINQQKTVIENLQHQLYLFRTAKFGRKSEKDVVSEELSLQFDEATPVEEEPVIEPDVKETTIPKRKTKKTGRKPLPKTLPYIEQTHDLSEEEKQCACGCVLTHIGNERTEQLDVVPQMTFRVVHIRKKYACKSCEETIATAKLPQQPIDKSIASPGLLAASIDAKFNRHMPLYRQEAMFKEANISVTRGTLSNWMIKSSNLLEPLVKLMTHDIQQYDIAYVDETTLQVLKEKNRLASQKSFMWLFIGGPPDKRAFVYQYHNSRSHKIPIDFFEDFKGYLHADCYQAYTSLGQQEHITHVACMAHARRYFVDVAKSSKKEGLAHQIIKLMGNLYQIESQLKDSNANPTTIFERRLKHAKPILDSIKAILDEKSTLIPPRSPLATAVFYTLNHWDSLINYLKDGRLEIDNNRAERAIKPFVIGRKNWLFHGNDIGAHAGSILFSLIETCKHHKIDVFSWLKYVLSVIRNTHTADDLEKLLPYNINPQLLNSMRSIPQLIIAENGGVN